MRKSGASVPSRRREPVKSSVGPWRPGGKRANARRFQRIGCAAGPGHHQGVAKAFDHVAGADENPRFAAAAG